MVLEQLSDSEWWLLGFFSPSLAMAEHRYSTFDQELLATYAATCNFQSSFEGRRCTLFTSHRPLSQAVQHSGNPWSPLQQCHISALVEFLVDVTSPVPVTLPLTPSRDLPRS